MPFTSFHHTFRRALISNLYPLRSLEKATPLAVPLIIQAVHFLSYRWQSSDQLVHPSGLHLHTFTSTCTSSHVLLSRDQSCPRARSQL